MADESPAEVYVIPRVVMASTRVRSHEKAVYQMVATVTAAGGEFPLPVEIAKAVGGTLDGVVQALRTLRDVGLLADDPRGSRVLPVPESWYRDAGLPPPLLVSPEPSRPRPKPITSVTVEVWMQEAMADRWGAGASPGRFGPKERTLAKRLVGEHGPTLLRDAIVAYVRGSSKPPTLIGFWCEREKWLAYVRETLLGRRTPPRVFRVSRARDDEYVRDERGSGTGGLGSV